MNTRFPGIIPSPYLPSRRQSDSVELIWEGKGERAKGGGINLRGRVKRPGAVKRKDVAVERRRIRLNSVVCGRLEEMLTRIEPKSVDFVYLDPPFMTQKDFAFNPASHRRHRLRLVGGDGSDENMVEEEKTSAETTPTGYSDRWCRTAYLDFLDTAFRLLKPTLKETGSIAVHTDHRASHWVRCLLDEHFSPDSFINELIWKYGLGNARSTRHFLRKHDNIAVYAASSMKKKKYYFKMIRGKVTKAQKAKYCHEDEGGKYMLSYGKKYYLKGGKPLESVLEVPALSATSSERTGYPTQKPKELLRILIEALCPPGGCVLDPCCGSGTTLVAAAESGRAWMGIDVNADAVRTAESQLRMGG